MAGSSAKLATTSVAALMSGSSGTARTGNGPAVPHAYFWMKSAAQRTW